MSEEPPRRVSAYERALIVLLILASAGYTVAFIWILARDIDRWTGG